MAGDKLTTADVLQRLHHMREMAQGVIAKLEPAEVITMKHYYDVVLAEVEERVTRLDAIDNGLQAILRCPV